MILTSAYVVAAIVITVDEYICGSTIVLDLQLVYLAISLPHTFQNEHPSSLWKYHCISLYRLHPNFHTVLFLKYSCLI